MVTNKFTINEKLCNTSRPPLTNANEHSQLICSFVEVETLKANVISCYLRIRLFRDNLLLTTLYSPSQRPINWRYNKNANHLMR